MFGFRRDRRRTGPPGRIPASQSADQVSTCPMARPRSRRRPEAGIRPSSVTTIACRIPRRMIRATSRAEGIDSGRTPLRAILVGRRASPPLSAAPMIDPRNCPWRNAPNPHSARSAGPRHRRGTRRSAKDLGSESNRCPSFFFRIGIRCRRVGASRTRERHSAWGHPVRRADAHAHRPNHSHKPDRAINGNTHPTGIARPTCLVLYSRYDLKLWMSKSPSLPYPR